MSDISSGQENQAGGPEALKAARETAGEAVQAVKAEAAHFAEAARDKATEQIESRKDAVTSAVSDFAEAIRKAGEELSQKDQTMAARLVGQAADGLQSLARSASEKSPEDMLNAARRFGRENPTAFLAGAVLAGLAIGRFARSSAEHATAPTTPPTSQQDIPTESGLVAQDNLRRDDDWNAPPMGSLS